MNPEKPYTAKGESIIMYNGSVYMITSKLHRDSLIERLNIAFEKGREKAMEDVKAHADKILERFGV